MQHDLRSLWPRLRRSYQGMIDQMNCKQSGLTGLRRGRVQVGLSHVTLQFLCKLLLAAVVVAATLPGLMYSPSVSPAVIASLLAGQVCLAPHTCYFSLARFTQLCYGPCYTTAAQNHVIYCVVPRAKAIKVCRQDAWLLYHVDAICHASVLEGGSLNAVSGCRLCLWQPWRRTCMVEYGMTQTIISTQLHLWCSLQHWGSILSASCS